MSYGERNSRLIAAMNAAGMSSFRLAKATGYDPKTIERWIAGRVPQPRNAIAAACALGVEPLALWPTLYWRRKPVPPLQSPPGAVLLHVGNLTAWCEARFDDLGPLHVLMIASAGGPIVEVHVSTRSPEDVTAALRLADAIVLLAASLGS